MLSLNAHLFLTFWRFGKFKIIPIKFTYYFNNYSFEPNLGHYHFIGFNNLSTKK